MTDINNTDQTIQYKITTLGKFDVVKGDHSLVMSFSSSKKIWELYKFMLTYKDRSFTPESLLDQLWVNQDYSDPKATLRRQMHRLRKALDEVGSDKNNTILFSNGYYYWNNTINIALDTHSFTDYINKGNSILNKDSQAALALYYQALDLYKGDYLPECFDQHWVYSIRNQYRRQLLTMILQMIDILKTSNSYDEILQICQKGIQIDMYEEIFQLNFMETLCQLGQHRQALDHYNYITNFYNREMGIEPSLEFKTLHKRMLMNSHNISSQKSLSEIFETEVTLNNAYYCEPNVFKSLYELERRRHERIDVSLGIGIITFNFQEQYTSSQNELRIRQLIDHLLTHLRKGDTFTRWNDHQLAVLLNGVDAWQTEIILNRVLKLSLNFISFTVNQIQELSSDPSERIKLEASGKTP